MQVTIANINPTGIIYYTTNGKDPRLIGGEVAGYSSQGGNSVIMDIYASTVIKSRILRNGEWSPLREVTFLAQQDDYSKLKVTEIHYHPQDIIEGTDTISGKSFEFIEFKNTGETAMDISGFVIDSAVYCQFPSNSILAPHAYFVAAAKPATFYETYGYVASANFSGNLSNSGEEILVLDAQGNEVIRFTYDDHFPWPEAPDGSGPSMVSVDVNPTGDPGNPYYWRTSYRIGGSPFENDTPLSLEDKEITAISQSHGILIYPNPTTGLLTLQRSDEYGEQAMKMELFNISGTLMYSTTIYSDLEIDLQSLDLRCGLYILRLDLADHVETHKIVYQP
jgi:hypothetical protein